jgi:tetratricopeptide (TPR) repeat protein
MSEFGFEGRPSRTAKQAAAPDSFARLNHAEHLRQQGELGQAQAICESLVRRHPGYAGPRHTLGLVLADGDHYEEALDCLVRAAMIDPRNGATLAALSGVYLRLGAVETAGETIRKAVSIKPRDTSVLLMLGDVWREEREYELARDAYGRAVALDPTLVPAAIGLGWCLMDLGELAEAAQVFERLITSGSRLIEPLRALAALPASVVGLDLKAHLDRAEREASEGKEEFETTAAFIRVIALDRAGRHAEAWRHAVEANRRVFRGLDGNVQRLAERRDNSLAALRVHSGHAGFGSGAQPISLFILGPSRSGKTTMEWLVSGLSGVKRGYENPIVETAVRHTCHCSSLPPESALERLPPPLYPLCRETYAEELARRVSSAKVFTNTNAGAIYEAALMIEVLGNVRFILMKRNLEDNLLRICMRRYTTGNAYGYDLKAARDHILWYGEMTDLMAEKFPNIVRVIRYEEMVADPAAALRTAAQLCGLPAPVGPPPLLAGDAGRAGAYRHLMAAELAA